MIRGPYKARIVDVHDGDTIHMDVDLGFGVIMAAYDLDDKPVLSCRAFGINARELHTELGDGDLLYAMSLLAPGDRVSVLSHGWDKYGGRFDGQILMPDGRDFSRAMLDAEHAVVFKGLHSHINTSGRR